MYFFMGKSVLLFPASYYSGVVHMDEILKEAAGSFGFGLKSFIRHKTSFLLDTNKGALLLKKQPEIKAAEALYKTSDTLHNAGFSNAERYLTAKGKPYLEFRDGIYTLSAIGEGAKCNLSNMEDAAAVAATLAKLHNAAEGLDFSYIRYSKSVFASEYSKRISEARRNKKWVDGRSRMSDIDVLFIKKYGEYMDAALSANDQIAEYLGSAKLCLCVDEIKEENLYTDSMKTVTLVNLENCALSASCIEVCKLIRRFVKRGGSIAAIPEIIGAYGSERKLAESDIVFMKAFLSFPQKFFVIINSYYSSKRNHMGSQALSRLKAEAAAHDRICASLKTI